MPGLVPGIHDFVSSPKTWMAGTSPAMTSVVGERLLLLQKGHAEVCCL